MASLGAALNDLLKDKFDGVPSNDQIAAALDGLIAKRFISDREAILLDAICSALVDSTSDGWSIKPIVGKQGGRKTKSEGQARKIKAEKYAAHVHDGGDAYARAKAKADGDKGAKEAYSEHLPEKRLARFMRARTMHEKRFEQIIARRNREPDSGQ